MNISWLKGNLVILLPVISLLQRVESRGQGCSMLLLIDDTFLKLLNNDQNILQQKIDSYIAKLNKIYQNTILKDPPNDNLYFYIKHVTILENFLPGCVNKGVVLRSIPKASRTSDYCLAHLLLHRNFGCVVGLDNLNGVCKKSSNTAWTSVNPEDDDLTVNTIAHEIGHNFGSEHDGGNSSTYAGCNTPDTMGIMGGQVVDTFSTCSLSAMHHRLQQVYREEEDRKCFTMQDEGTVSKYQIDTKDMSEYHVDCPEEPKDDNDGECDQQPDPPEVPEPPEPVCGDQVVDDPAEECDCGQDWAECDDPCCYPANLTPADLAVNNSAIPCSWNQSPLCVVSPAETFWKFGLIAPFLAILLLAILVALMLIIDWKYGRRMLYTHITSREHDPLHIENQDQRDRRLNREKNIQGIQSIS